jgi:hypothetical protein
MTMLTDVFVTRYEDRRIWTSFGERERRFMVQASTMITEQLFPFYTDGKVNEFAKGKLQLIHDKIAMEIGVEPLSPLFLVTYRYPISEIIKNYMRADFSETLDPDIFIKRRLSLVEVAFREYQQYVDNANKNLISDISNIKKSETASIALTKSVFRTQANFHLIHNTSINDVLAKNVIELNERFRQARFPLVYHNGFIQISEDSTIAQNIEAPFWKAIADPKWQNVAHDISEAIDRRDTKRRDAALAAAMALESCIKIISDEKGWTKPKQNGAASYIDNLVSEQNGRFIEVWESELLKSFFREVRNKLGHGAGTAPMLTLTQQQDSWAIEACMSWVKSLVTRL